MTTDQTADRTAGTLLGVHAGDSLGATMEFKAPNENPGTWVRDIVGGGPFNWNPGDATDDTDLTLAVVRGYLDTELTTDVDTLLDGIASHFIAWYRSDPRDIGGTTAQAMRRLSAGGSPHATGVAELSAQANGGVMRAAPTGAARADTAIRRAESAAISSMTHASPVCVAAAVAYNDIVAGLIDGAAPEDAINAALDGIDEPLVTTTLRDRLTSPTDAPMPWTSGGWVITALDIACWATRQIDRPLEDLLIEVINKGGDADTNGAIAGGMLGARDGATAIPDRWLSTLQYGEELAAAAKVFADRR